MTKPNSLSNNRNIEDTQSRNEEIETFNEKEHSIAKSLRDSEGPVHVDEIARKLSLSVTETMSTLTMMEVRGIVQCTEGALYDLSNRRAEIGAPRLLDEGQPA